MYSKTILLYIDTFGGDMSDVLKLKFRLCSRDITICFGKEQLNDDEMKDDVVGIWRPKRNVIGVEDCQTQQGEITTLIHEILEATNDIMGLALEHRQIEGLESAIYTLLTENGYLSREWGFRDLYKLLSGSKASRKVPRSRRKSPAK